MKNPSESGRFHMKGLHLTLSIIMSRYSTFVRIGSGLSFADYVWVRDKPWKTWDPKHPPEFLLTAKRSHEDKGDIYLEPEESVAIVRSINTLTDL